MQRAIIYFMEVNATFNLREPKKDKPTNICLVCSINGRQIKINIGTQHNICPRHWDKATQTAIINPSLEKIYIEHHTEINKRIQECLKRFNEWKKYIADNTNQIYDSETLLRKYIKGETTSLESNPIDWFNHYIDNLATVRESSKAQYRRDVKVFARFIKEKKVQLNSFSQFTYEVLINYEKYLIEKQEKVRTINNKVRTLKTLLNNAEKYSLIDLNKNRISKHNKLKNEIKSDNSIYLTDEEIERIYNLELTGIKETARDIFIVQYHLGQRISDIVNLKNATIRENEIELFQKKTNTQVTIPIITPIVKEILSKYNNSFPEDIVSDTVKLNSLLKEIAKEAQINEEVTEREQRGTTVEIKKIEKWQLISTHVARHSYITNMLLKGYPKEIIKQITGHKTDYAFQTYNNITSKEASKFILDDKREVKKEQVSETTQFQKERDDINTDFEWDSEEKIKEYLITKLKEKRVFNSNRDTRVFIDTIVWYYLRYKDKYNSEIDLYSDIDISISKILEVESEHRFSEDSLRKITDEIANRLWKIDIIL